MSDKELDRILYAEDEPDIQTVAQMALETIGGFTLNVCNNGQEAVDKAIDFNPDLILMDVMMPIMTGPDALKALRELPEIKDVPVIFMTAKVQPQEVEEYKALGAVEVIAKPFDPMTLSDTVQEIWQRAND
jgi:CheY-like chemotaxis protein